MTIAANGHVFYQDEYSQKYEVEWATVNGVIDITTTIQQPYVWGQPEEVRIENGILYKMGIITIHRQAIEILNDGYVIIAEGSSQYDDFIQMNYNCEKGPADNFKYHLNNNLIDDISAQVINGPHWADPNEELNVSIWCDLNADGSPIISGNINYLEWTDIWVG